MSESPELSSFLVSLAQTDPDAVQGLWERYYERLIRLAHRNMQDLRRRDVDAEDIAQSAMNSFLQGAAQGRYPDLRDRDDLWKLLVTVTLRKVSKQRRRERATKRGGGQLRGESVFQAATDAEPAAGMAEFSIDEHPPPDVAVELGDTLQELLRDLGNEELRDVALLKLEGYSGEEIAEKLQVARRTVVRRLQRIRESLTRLIESNSSD